MKVSSWLCTYCQKNGGKYNNTDLSYHNQEHDCAAYLYVERHKNLKVCVFLASICSDLLSPVYLEENCNDDGNFKEKKAADGNNILKSKSRKEII